MSPAARYSRWQKGNSSHNVSKAKGHKFEEQDDLDVRSATTASTACSSWSTSDEDDRRWSNAGRRQGEQLLGMICANSKQANLKKKMPPPPPPPMEPPPKTRLQSGAALFVPKAAFAPEAPPFVPEGTNPMAPPSAPAWPPAAASGKDCLKDVIFGTLGGEVWNLAMGDCQSSTGEFYTAVEITIPALSASLCHLATSDDPEEIAAGQQATQSMALQSLLESLQNLSPKMTVMPSEDGSQLSVEYCGADRDMLCWEFAHTCHCPRGSTCRWAHAIVETFLISFMLQPLMQWSGPEETTQQQSEAEGAPMGASLSEQSNSSTLPALPMTNIFEQKGSSSLDDPDDTPWPECVQDRSFGMKELETASAKAVEKESKAVTPVVRPRRIPSGRSWADIQEDSDGDEADGFLGVE